MSVSRDFCSRGDLLTGVDVEVVMVDTVAGILRNYMPVAHWDSYTVDVLLRREGEIFGGACFLYDVRSWSSASTNHQAPTPQHVLVNVDLGISLRSSHGNHTSSGKSKHRNHGHRKLRMLVSDIIYVFYAVEGCIYPTCHDGSKLNLHSIIISTTDNFLHIWSQQNGLENVS